MSEVQVIPLAPYKHSEWGIGELQTPIKCQPSPYVLTQIGRLIAESIEEQHPGIRVCVVNVPILEVSASVIAKGGSE